MAFDMLTVLNALSLNTALNTALSIDSLIHTVCQLSLLFNPEISPTGHSLGLASRKSVSIMAVYACNFLLLQTLELAYLHG